MARTKWHKSKFPGVRWREHESRRNGPRPARYYTIRFMVDGRSIEERLGWDDETDWTEAKAFAELCRLKENAKSGQGPASRGEEHALAKEERRREALERERQKTMEQAVKLFMAQKAKSVRAKTLQYYKDGLDRAMAAEPGKDLPQLKEWRLPEIERRHLAQVIEDEAEKSVSMAICIRSSLSALYSWLAQSPRELVPANIVREIPKPGRLAPRDRSLSNEEIGQLWRELSKSDHAEEVIPRMVRFALLTGCRLSDAAGLDRCEVRGNWWEIPAGRFKGKRAHRVFLTREAKSLLGDADKPFHSEVVPKEPDVPSKALDPSSVNRNLTRRNFYGLAKFSLHDLRRTVTSGLASLGFPLEVLAAVQGHKLPGVTAAHYLKHSYDRERQQAMEAWTRHVLSCAVEAEAGTAEIIPITTGKTPR